MKLRLVLALFAAACAVPAVAAGAERMLIGFQDDPGFRWRDDRQEVLDQAQQANAGIVRTTIYWSRIAPTRPANPTNPFDKTYRLNDVDEMVREAELRGMEVMFTIWGTPDWANGGKGQQYAPTNFQDLTNFARALASRYNGRRAGYPFVRYYTVWNESNLGQFLSPQYDETGKPVAPAIYAKLYRAAYKGIKAGNPLALVGIGETSARGRDRFLGKPGAQETESPGKFAELLSQQRPALKFDAWSHHPYPTSPNLPPTQKVRWPNVTLLSLPRFEQALDTWFGRPNIPIWITEYGHETKPGEPLGVTLSQQSAYAKQAITLARKDPRVQMFIWFILRDDPTSAWQSGLVERDGSNKPAFNTFSSLAHLLDGRNPILTIKAGTKNPLVRVAATALLAKNGAGENIGISFDIRRGSSLVGSRSVAASVQADGTLSFRVTGITVAKNQRYTLDATLEDIHGNSLERAITLIAA